MQINNGQLIYNNNRNNSFGIKLLFKILNEKVKNLNQKY